MAAEKSEPKMSTASTCSTCSTCSTSRTISLSHASLQLVAQSNLHSTDIDEYKGWFRTECLWMVEGHPHEKLITKNSFLDFATAPTARRINRSASEPIFIRDRDDHLSGSDGEQTDVNSEMSPGDSVGDDEVDVVGCSLVQRRKSCQQKGCRLSEEKRDMIIRNIRSGLCSSDRCTVDDDSETDEAFAMENVEGFLHCEEVPLTDDEGVPSGPLPSKGAAMHRTGFCQPCFYFNTKAGCKSGTDCTFCHDDTHTRTRRFRPSKSKRIKCKRFVDEMCVGAREVDELGLRPGRYAQYIADQIQRRLKTSS